ncbi:hypothetical protein K3366_RS26230, partial [Escherichia coli]
LTTPVDEAIDAATNPPTTTDLTRSLQRFVMSRISARVAKALPIRKCREICLLSAKTAISAGENKALEIGEEKLNYCWQYDCVAEVRARW